MNNYRLTIDLQADSNETITAFAAVLAKVVPRSAASLIEALESEDAHLILGETTLKNADDFRPNAIKAANACGEPGLTEPGKD